MFWKITATHFIPSNGWVYQNYVQSNLLSEWKIVSRSSVSSLIRSWTAKRIGFSQKLCKSVIRYILIPEVLMFFSTKLRRATQSTTSIHSFSLYLCSTDIDSPLYVGSFFSYQSYTVCIIQNTYIQNAELVNLFVIPHM